MDVETIVNEVFEEAKNGVVSIDCNGGYWSFFVKFYLNKHDNTNKLNNKFPIVNVSDYNEFIKRVEDYLIIASEFYSKDIEYFDLSDKKAYLKKLFLDLICNATIYNLNNINEYIDIKTKQLLDDKVILKEKSLGKYGSLDIECCISKNPSNLEAPYKMSISFIDENNEKFLLPNITFAIIDDMAYVMCIQSSNKSHKDNVLSKKLDRYFRKVNKGVEDEEISKVSPNALVALTIFSSYLSNMKVDKIVAPNFMPIRYNNLRVKLFNKYKNDKAKKDEEIEKIDYIQSNITEKFMNLFLRYAYHFSSDLNYDDIKDEMNLTLNGKKNRLDDNIIYDIDDAIKSFKNITLTRK